MTRTTNARIAGITFLVYIAATITSMLLFARATSGVGVTAQLAAIAQHATGVRLTILLGLLQSLSALVLAVTLYAITREQPKIKRSDPSFNSDPIGTGRMDVSRTLGLLWLATATQATAPDAGAASALAAFFLKVEGSFNAGAFFFAVGSTLFWWLLLRGHMIPAVLAWLGVLASILPVVCFPLQIAGLLGAPVTSLMWFPILVFEVALALWLIIKGVAAPTPRHAA